MNVIADPWTRTQLTNGSAVSTPEEWDLEPIPNPRPIRSLVWHDMEGYLAGAIGFGLLLLPLFPVIGTSIYGSRIWIQIGPFSFQPGESCAID